LGPPTVTVPAVKPNWPRLSAGVLVPLLIGWAASLAAQGTRSLSGHVFSAVDSAPLPKAQVSLLGTDVVTHTDLGGHFRLRVPAQAVTLVVRGLGIAPDTVSISAGQDTVRIYAEALPFVLPPVRVAAPSPARARFDTLAQTSTVTLSRRDITHAPALLEPDILRAVQLLPGTVSRSDYSIGYDVRGGESDQNLVQLDGITIFNPSHLGGLFSTFDADAVDHADFLTGGFPAEYSDRLSSVLDIGLRSGDRTGVHGSGAVSLLSSKLLVDGPVGTGSFLLSARRTYADEVLRVFTSNNLPYYFTDLLGKLDFPYGVRGDLSITGYWGRDVLTPNLIPGSTAQTPIDLAFDWGNRLVGVNWRQPVGAATLEQHVSATAFSSGLAIQPNLVGYNNQAVLWSAGSTFSIAPGGHHSLHAGLAFEQYDMTYAISNPAVATPLSTVGGSTAFGSGANSPAFFDTRYRPAVLAGFLDDQWQPIHALLLHAGVRVEHVAGPNTMDVSPRANVKLFLSRDQALTASAGSYYQAVQSLSDPEVPISIYEFWVGANGRVPVAHSDQVVLGYERWLGHNRGTQLTIEGYGKTFDNLIRPNTALAMRDTENAFLPVSGRAWGVDVLLRRQVGTIQGWIAYSFLISTRASDGLDYPADGDRRHTLNVVVQAPGPLHSDLGVRLGYGSPLPFTSLVGEWDHGVYSPTYGGFTDDVNTEPVGGPLNGARYPAYARLDVGLRWHGHRWGLDWQPYVNVVNLFDRRNVFFYFVDTDSTPPQMTVIYQLPIVLTFGVDFSW
jgi:hypothetical protein